MSDFSNYEYILLVGLVFYIQAHIMMKGLEARWKSGGKAIKEQHWWTMLAVKSGVCWVLPPPIHSWITCKT